MVADRVNKRRVLVILQSLMALEALALAILTSTKIISVRYRTS